MSEDSAKKKPKGGMMGLIVGVVLMLVSGGGSFYAVYSGMLALPLPEKEPKPVGAAAEFAEPLPTTAFLPLDPIIVTVGRGDALRHLQFAAQLEIEPGAHDAVALLTPRAVDVLNTYLRAVEPADIEDPAALLRMRAQMLRRVQVVMGEGKVRDLLVAEFIMR
jgi:flagellar FliL protein